jgi:ribosome-associated protein
MAADVRSVEWVQIAAAAAADKKAEDIVAFDVSEVLVITDAFLVCTAANPRQAAAVADEVERRLKEAGSGPARREGHRDGEWTLLDFVDIVVHVQLPEARLLYDLERLWRDQPKIDVADVQVTT